MRKIMRWPCAYEFASLEEQARNTWQVPEPLRPTLQSSMCFVALSQALLRNANLRRA